MAILVVATLVARTFRLVARSTFDPTHSIVRITYYNRDNLHGHDVQYHTGERRGQSHRAIRSHLHRNNILRHERAGPVEFRADASSVQWLIYECGEQWSGESVFGVVLVKKMCVGDWEEKVNDDVVEWWAEGHFVHDGVPTRVARVSIVFGFRGDDHIDATAYRATSALTFPELIAAHHAKDTEADHRAKKHYKEHDSKRQLPRCVRNRCAPDKGPTAEYHDYRGPTNKWKAVSSS
jgi:hypothetical protein